MKQLSWVLGITGVASGALLTAAAFQVSMFTGYVTASVAVAILGIGYAWLDGRRQRAPMSSGVVNPTARRRRKKSRFNTPYWKDTAERSAKTFSQAFLSTFVVPVGFNGITKVGISAVAAGLSALTSMGSKGFGVNQDSASLVR